MGSVDKARTLLRRIHRGAIRLFHRGPQEEGNTGDSTSENSPTAKED